MNIQGNTGHGFEPVFELFKSFFDKGFDKNSQLCIYIGDEKVVDLCGSNGDKVMLKGEIYNQDTVQAVYSSGKSVASILCAIMVDQGRIKYDEPVSNHWPQFASNGKENITLEQVLRHESGLQKFSQSIKLSQLSIEQIKNNEIGQIIEKESPCYPKEGKSYYHAITRDWITNEIFRRVEKNGLTMGEYLQTLSQEFEMGIHLGYKGDNLAKLQIKPIQDSFAEANLDKDSKERSFPQDITEIQKYFGQMKKNAKTIDQKKWEFDGVNPMEFFKIRNDLEYLEGETASCNVVASARGLAKLGAIMANKGHYRGKRLLSEETWHLMHSSPRIEDTLPLIKTNFYKGGVNAFEHIKEIDPIQNYMYQGRDGFVGWIGFGGSVFQWHPELKIGFAYIPTYMELIDNYNFKAGQLQKLTRECAMKLVKHKL